MKILIVDDSRAMRMIVTRTLKQTDLSGYTTIEASNGMEALELIDSESPDLVLSDWNMPEMNGIELLTKIREQGNRIKFGFITSESSVETKQLAHESGANFIVTKPFNAEMLEAVISPAMAS